MLTGCQNTTNKDKWQELPCGLWVNKDGDIGLKQPKQ